MTATASEPALDHANGEDEPASYSSLKQQLAAVLAQQVVLINRVEDNTSHVLKLHQLHDPLTWKKRAAILFAGAFAGAGLSTTTALFLMHLTIHIAAH